MVINIYSILKQSKDNYTLIEEELSKTISKFAKIKKHNIFSKDIAKAQNISAIEAKKSYTIAFSKYLNGYNIALDVKGKKLDSYAFSKIFNKSNINFFIGGAYGFEEEFLRKCDLVISLSELTFSHKIANLVLYEQILRGLAIKNNHPYHKI